MKTAHYIVVDVSEKTLAVNKAMPLGEAIAVANDLAKKYPGEEYTVYRAVETHSVGTVTVQTYAQT